ncbi:MAG: glutamate racemase [Calditrichaeota bacterium]|nr:MAG: glutamate racemase [Calditrichota bacterium]
MENLKHDAFDNRPVGVFDSGVGGLTVVKQLLKKLPSENIIYFGDTARIPYGTKSEEIVRRFALEDSIFLLDKNVKIIVVACNTASAIAVPMLQDILGVPVVGVLEPGASAAVRYSVRKKIGVIGTAATIRSSSYQREIKRFSPEAQVLTQACPLFVPLVEEGWTEDETTYLIADRYLHNLKENGIDTLILGCTHYPLLKNAIQKTVGDDVKLVDSGVETAFSVENILKTGNLLADPNRTSSNYFYLSDMPYKFQEIAERFLERSVPHVETVNFDQFLMGKGEKFWKKYQIQLTKIY